MSVERRSWAEAVSWLRQQPDQRELVRACYFDDPLCDAAARYAHSSEWRAVRRWLPCNAGRALDLGAGRGISSYALAVGGWRVTALEPDASELVGAAAIRRLAAETGLSVEVSEEQAERMSFPDATFDLVHGRQVLHHARDVSLFCREAFRVLRSSGRFIATREHVIDRPEDLSLFQSAHPLHRLYGGEMAYSLSTYLTALRDAGFRAVAVLGPFDSPMNLPPDDSPAYQGVKGAANRVLRWCAKGGTFRSLAARMCSRACRVPGRLYSFVMEKP